MRYLITGTGRCGTLYAARYLQAKGLDIRHEKMGKDGTVNWWLACSWELAPVPIFDKVLHIVREPLATISSLTTCLEQHEIWKHIIPNTPVYETDPVLLRCMKHWLYWNLNAEAIADQTLRIEDWSMETMGEFFGITGPEPEVPKDTHTWKGRFKAHTWDDLRVMEPELTRLIRQKARRYGYSYDETHLDRRQHL
jgi:hypothetical protein